MRNVREILKGDWVIAQQMRPPAVFMGAEEGVVYGGGTSPVRTHDTIQPEDVGTLAMWTADGTIGPAIITPVPEAPDDGLSYARRGWDKQWVPVATDFGLPEAPVDGRNYTRNGQIKQWMPLPFLLPEAPTTGQGFVRVGLNHQWEPAFTQCDADSLYAPK